MTIDLDAHLSTTGGLAPVTIDAGDDLLEVVLTDDDGPMRLARLGRRGGASPLTAGQPLIELVTVDAGHAPSTPRLVGGAASSTLRYRSHETTRDADATVTLVRLATEDGLHAEARLEVPRGAAAVRVTVTVENRGERTRVLRSLTSIALRVGLGPDGVTAPDGLLLSSAVSDWVGESRWTTEPLRERLVDLRSAAHDNGDARGCFAQASSGTWSTGRALPIGVLAVPSNGSGSAIAWQVEHNGGWRWEVGENAAGSYLALSGPTDADHQWLLPLAPGDAFTTVPATVAVGDGLEGAVAALTTARRTLRRPHPDDARRPVVFNDYMNTLMGDPTTERLLPLIDQAAEAGAEIFCIDAGWYDDSGDWWYSVGDWQPSTVRFPGGGLKAVLDRIRERDMVPGLWLEPEVIGVDSPAALRLPDEAFLQRAGQRVVEHGRFHLDLRHPASTAHLDEVVDRLVAELGVGYFKLDYNINPGPGTDRDGGAPGVELLEHNRAHLAWLRRVLDRHPDLVLENCGSGAMRMDFAMLSLLQLQSTSDQQSSEAYPPIAAVAPLSMTPEQAANWAYPQPDMTDEEIAFTLCTAMLGRFYLSGRLDGMTAAQRMLVAEGVAAHKRLRPSIAAGTATWPLGIDLWRAPWVALGLGDDDAQHLTLWRRPDAPATVDVPLPTFQGGPLDVDVVFPRRLTPWSTSWDSTAGVLSVTVPEDGPAARTFRIGRRPQADQVVVDATASTGAVHGGATGMLYGLAAPGVPSVPLLAGVRPRTVAQKAPEGRQHPGGDALETADDFFSAGGGEVLVYLQDALAAWPYEEVGVEAYTGFVREAARRIATRPDRDRFVYVPFNEGDWIWYPDWHGGDRERFLADWATVVGALREEHPGARVAGPNESHYYPERVRDFLTHTASVDLLPDVMSWHELQPSSLEVFPKHLVHYRALEHELGITPRPVNIDEYANRRDTSVPGRLLQWIDVLETGKVDGDLAYWTMAGNLDDSAVGDREANGGWWLLHWYAALRGETLVATTPSAGVRDSLHALAAREGDVVTVLLGGGRHDLRVAITGLPATERVRIRVERAGWSGYEGALATTALLLDESVPVTAGTAVIEVPNDDPLAAYRVAVVPGAVPVTRVDSLPAVAAIGEAAAMEVEWVRYDDDWQQYAGTGRRGVAAFTSSEGRIELRLASVEDGEHELVLLYGTDGRPGAVMISVDGASPVALELPATLMRGFLGRAVLRLTPAPGEHQVVLTPAPTSGPVAIDRVELSPVTRPRRFEAAQAIRDGGTVTVDREGHAAVRLDSGDAVRFFVGAAARAQMRLRTEGTEGMVTTVHGVRIGADAEVVLPQGITEVTITAQEQGTITALEVEPFASALAVLGVDDAAWTRTGGAHLIPDGEAVVLDLGDDGTAGLPAPLPGRYLLTLRYSNADRLTGHEYNADVVSRRLRVRAGSGRPVDAAFPFTHDWSNFRDLSVMIDVPLDATQVLLERGDGPAPLVTGAVLERISREDVR